MTNSTMDTQNWSGNRIRTCLSKAETPKGDITLWEYLRRCLSVFHSKNRIQYPDCYFLVSSECYIVVVQFITAETISYIEVVSLLKNNEYIV